MIYSPNFARLTDTVFLTEGATGVDIGPNAYGISNKTTTTGAGRSTAAQGFNGSVYIQYANTVIPNGAKTIEVVCYLDSTSSESLVDNGGGTSTQHGSLLIIGSGKFNVYNMKGASGDARFQITGSATLTTGKWYYLVLTWDGTTGASAAVTYINGVSDASATADSTESGTPTNNFQFGRFNSGNSPLNGRIQAVRVGNTAATAAFIAFESKRMGIV